MRIYVTTDKAIFRNERWVTLKLTRGRAGG